MEFTTKIRDETGAPNFKEILNFLTFLQETFTPLITQRDGGKSVKTLDATKVTPVLKKHSPCQNKKIPDVKSPEEFPALGVQTKKSTWNHSKPRRINPTPIGKATTVFQASTSTPAINSVFTSTPTILASSTLHEEHRLLIEERNKQGNKHNKKQRKGFKQLDNKLESFSLESHLPETSSIANSKDSRTHPHDCRSTVTTDLEVISLSAVSDKVQLDNIALCYSTLLKEMLVPNITTELYFLIQLLTLRPNKASVLKDAPFSNISNCVYFSVAVISHVKFLFAVLDGRTLHLLSQNSRVEEFSPGLSNYFLHCYQMKETQTGPDLLPHHHTFGVPFQVETDNRKNFISDRAFHTFKKQRDMFYELLKEWEKNQDNPNWHRGKEKIRSMMDCDSSGMPHFAKLFQRQLVENSKHTQKIGNVEDPENEVVNNLKKSNPNKFLRLHERFSKLSSSHGGPCPSPHFTQQEQFYTEFLLATDSYTFNQLLKQQLFSEITRLNTKSQFESTTELADTITTLRLLAKYLGFLVFLPYQNVPASFSAEKRTQVEPFNILQCVKDCCNDGTNLVITIPWVVEFCAMMDSEALTVPYYCELLTSLIGIYRSLSSIKEDGGSFSAGHMLLLASLGWLFELHALSNGLFYNEAPKHSTSSDYTISYLEMIDDSLLLRCCPYLGELHRLLSEFSAGSLSKTPSVRKIKPVSMISEDPSLLKEKQIQTQLQENFFRNQPSYLKKLCEMIAERMSTNIVVHTEQHILPQCVLLGLRDLVHVIKHNIGDIDSDEDVETFLDVSPVLVSQTIQKYTQLVIQQTQEHFDSYCSVTVRSALQPLLVGTPLETVLDASTSVTVSMTKEHHRKWVCREARGLLSTELDKQLSSTKKIISLSAKKSGDRVLSSKGYFCCEDASEELQSGIPTATMFESLPGYDVLMGKVKEVESSLHATTLFDQGQLQDLVTSVTTWLARELFIIPDVLIPQLLPRCSSEIASVTFQLSVILVSSGNLRRSHIPHSTTMAKQCSLLDAIVHLWKLLKAAKLSLPCDELLSHKSFQLYLTSQTSVANIWSSLSETLVTLLCHNILTSPIIEALWVCRIEELNDDPTKKAQCLQGAYTFLKLFYTDSTQDISSSMVEMKDVHFLRLLAVVLESGIDDIPAVLKSYSHYCKLIHPI
ncbi:codanin-1-like isoform X2 [Dysidea avara]|uniref:codanin-1-like isoform X2 n=1 Tax=Dysidea avara TaxID=196820 RepID=UPI0033204E35